MEVNVVLCVPGIEKILFILTIEDKGYEVKFTDG